MSTVLAWGRTSSGALGLGDSVGSCITVPHQVPSLENVEVKNISSGQSHTLICLKDGSVLSCGANDFKQCGREGVLVEFGRVECLGVQHVIQVATGSSHSLVLTQAHEVFTWGKNDKGQLGRGEVPKSDQEVPRLVKSLAVYCVLQVSCGSDHTIALTNDGLVFVWGSNSFGQLGLGRGTDCYQSLPELISCLRGIPILQVTAGGNHNFILSKSGAVYGWGRNSFGQLGLNDIQDYNLPQQCRPIRSQRIKYICCGENHTACLTKDGRVFTFGDGGYGQLGHNSYNNEILPRQVIELSGSEVSQIACGRYHTLAYVPKTGRLYAFGLGDSGQLGLSSRENKTSPFSVQGPFAPSIYSHAAQSSMQIDGEGPELRIRSIHAGGDQSFIVAQDAEQTFESDDYRIEDPSKQILTLSQSKLKVLHSLNPAEIPSTEITDEFEKIFSSASCLNGSFLLPNDEHYGSSSKKHGLDMNAVREYFQELAKVPNIAIMQYISTNLEQHLIPMLPASPPDVEALRLYLILPECHIFEEPKLYSSVICPFAKNLLSLNVVALRVFDSWWPSNGPSFFGRLVAIYKQCIEYLLQLPDTSNLLEANKREVGLIVTFQMLQKLHQINEANNQIIPYHKYYVPELKDKVNIRVDYINWLQKTPNRIKFGGITVHGFYLCNYPFVFDGAAKSILLQTDATLQMQHAVDNAQRQNFWGLLSGFTMQQQSFDMVSPCFVLTVTRHNLVQDTLRQLQGKSSAHFKKPLKVIFQGEEAVDEGGVRKEFFMLLLREVMDPKYGMFKTHDISNLQWFNHSTFEEPNMFGMIGIICGLAIYNFTIIDLHFPLALYKKLLKKPVTLDDLKELMPQVGKGLQEIIDYSGDDMEDVFSLAFEVFEDQYGERKSVELVPDGANKLVNQSNKQDYINLYVDYILNKSVEVQFHAFSEGFHIVCGGVVMDLFHPKELQAMVVGNEEYDFHEFEKNTEYKGEYYRYHPTISLFWEVFHEMSLEDKKKFLLFLTGTDRIPVFGMKYVKMVIQPMGGGEDFLPVAHTCFNLLDLPKYTTKERLKSKLLQSIQHTEGFGLV